MKKVNDVQRIIYDRYGEAGMRVYELSDGKRTATQIMHQSGVDRALLVEILDFLDGAGIVRLNHAPGP